MLRAFRYSSPGFAWHVIIVHEVNIASLVRVSVVQRCACYLLERLCTFFISLRCCSSRTTSFTAFLPTLSNSATMKHCTHFYRYHVGIRAVLTWLSKATRPSFVGASTIGTTLWKGSRCLGVWSASMEKHSSFPSRTEPPTR